ncbi:Uncharacterised protein [Mycobacteroides abscessus subsp. abscessus]|nr:Uncharacterised protein [Mycobacteroides abscessus subsp. abscessus]
MLQVCDLLVEIGLALLQRVEENEQVGRPRGVQAVARFGLTHLGGDRQAEERAQGHTQYPEGDLAARRWLARLGHLVLAGVRFEPRVRLSRMGLVHWLTPQTTCAAGRQHYRRSGYRERR